MLSKNDERDFTELCRKRSDFLLKREHFSASSISWQPKPEGLARIAEQLRIGADSILVIDDNLGEIAQIRAAHANTPLLHSQNPAQTLFWLRHYPTLNGYRANSATSLRVDDLEASRKREQLRDSTSTSDYVREMQIEITYALNAVASRARLAELSQKTNQFNTGLQRFSEVVVGHRLKEPGHYTISIAMRDKFCDSGIIGAIFARVDGGRLVVDEVSVSCRASRTQRRESHDCSRPGSHHRKVRIAGFGFLVSRRTAQLAGAHVVERLHGRAGHFRWRLYNNRVAGDPAARRTPAGAYCLEMGECEPMTRPQIQSTVAELLTITLGRPVAQNESVSRDAESTWDSLKHVQLILMLEEQFGIQFSEEEMGSLRDSDGIVRAVEAKNAA